MEILCWILFILFIITFIVWLVFLIMTFFNSDMVLYFAVSYLILGVIAIIINIINFFIV